jgi:hypothetical protein
LVTGDLVTDFFGTKPYVARASGALANQTRICWTRAATKAFVFAVSSASAFIAACHAALADVEADLSAIRCCRTVPATAAV